ncbi:MAG: VOC family protein [Bacteriovoracaceae bacterium]
MLDVSKESSMNIKLDHINLTVRNLQESMSWYHELFGFEFKEGDVTSASEPWAIVGKNDSMICMYEDKNLKPASDNSDGVHRIYHFGLRISEKEAWEKIVQEKNLKIMYGGAYQYPHSLSWYIHDPSGHEIEVSYVAGGGTLAF